MFKSINVKIKASSILYGMGTALIAVALIIPPEWLSF